MVDGKSEVIYVRLESEKKKALKEEAGKLGMPLTTYCRMVLIKDLEAKRNENKGVS